MAFMDDCLAEVEKAFEQRAGRKIRPDEIDDLMAEFMKRRKQRQAADNSSLDQAVIEAADDYAREMAEAAIIEKRNAVISLRTRLEAWDFLKTQFADDPRAGFTSLLVGTAGTRKGSRSSVAAEQDALKGFYLSGLMADLERSGTLELLRDGAVDREVANAMWKLFRKEPLDTSGMLPQVKQLAEIMHKWQEVARKDANDAGAWIKARQGYIVKQSHDQWKISQAGEDAWIAAIENRLDWAEMNLPDGMTTRQYLSNVYENLASGQHLKNTGDAPSGFKGPGNLAKRVSQDRTLIFKSADDWFEYNQQFGTGNLREALFRGLEHSAKTTGLMRKLGPNPEANLNMLVDLMKQSMVGKGVDQRTKFAAYANGMMRNYMAAVDGSMNIPVNAMVARYSAAWRAIESMAKLGAAVLSQFGDIPIFARVMNRNGVNYFEGLAQSINAVFAGRSSREKRLMANAMGIYHQTLAGDMVHRFSLADDSMPGRISSMQRTFFKMNLMAGWTDNQRFAAIMTIGNHLAEHSKQDWGGLQGELRRLLGLYNIDEGKWNLIRKAGVSDQGGYRFIDPNMVDNLPDADFKAYLADNGKGASDRSVGRFKREVADALRAYYTDQVSHAVIEPDARTRAIMTQGTRPGTWPGEVARMIGQFKAFPVAYIQKGLAPDIAGRDMAGLAQLIAGSLAFGYIAMSAKDMVKGRNPRDPASLKTWIAAFQQGGGAGIYGDFLFGQVKNRFGQNLVTTIAGPTGGAINDVADLWGRLREGDDFAATTFRKIINHAPFANLFYTRAALDYLILHSVGEAMNPGYLKRVEKRIEKENDQTFWVRPSKTYLDPLGIAR